MLVNDIDWVVGEKNLGRRGGLVGKGKWGEKKGGNGGFTLEHAGCNRLCHLYGSKWPDRKIFRHKRGRGLDQ